MGNKFTYDEQVEDLVKKIALTYQFTQVDKFFR